MPSGSAGSTRRSVTDMTPKRKPELVQPAHDKRCPGCGGISGRHTNLGCGYLKDEAARMLPRGSRKDGGK